MLGRLYPLFASGSRQFQIEMPGGEGRKQEQRALSTCGFFGGFGVLQR